MKTIAIISQKGGAGKTTLSVHLATAASLSGHSAAIIDLDPQGTAASWGDRRQADAPEVVSGQAARLGVLIEAAHRLARFDPKWRAMALRLRTAGKPGSVTAAAVANRWVRWLFHQMQPTAAAA